MQSGTQARYLPHVTRMYSGTDRERNLFAAVFGAVLVVLLIIALALPNWYYLNYDDCCCQVFGIEQFFSLRSTKTLKIADPVGNVSDSKMQYLDLNEGIHNLKRSSALRHTKNLHSFFHDNEMKNCITSEAMLIQKAIVCLSLITILLSSFQCYLDVTGTNKKYLKTLRKCGTGSIISVIIIIVIIGLCYYMTQLMEQQLIKTTSIKPEITFGISYYLISAGGLMAILAAASNLFFCNLSNENADVALLLDDNQEETFSIAMPQTYSWSHLQVHNTCTRNLPPPYTP